MANPWSDTLDLDEARKGSGVDFDPSITEAAPEGMTLDIYRYRPGGSLQYRLLLLFLRPAKSAL